MLNLKLGAEMSFYIARYQEGTTWPEEYSFREPDYREFFLVLKPRLDVQLSWFDRRIRLRHVISSNATWGIGPVDYRIEFDGLTFKPKDGSLLSQTFEVPSLATLASTGSEVKLFAHNKSTKNKQLVPDGTDIAIELVGIPREAEWLYLYRSHMPKELRNILKTNYLSLVLSAQNLR